MRASTLLTIVGHVEALLALLVEVFHLPPDLLTVPDILLRQRHEETLAFRTERSYNAAAERSAKDMAAGIMFKIPHFWAGKRPRVKYKNTAVKQG